MPESPFDHPAALPKGRRLAEYEVVRVLGAGGYGITYLAFDHQLDGPVAIKEYFPAELATRADGGQVAATVPTHQETFAWGLERFLDEARAVHRFRHPNVVQAHRYLEANGTAYLVMEYVEGESLKAILHRRGRLSAEEWRPWLDNLLEGLEHVHSHGYLHRDIKPANIVVRSENDEPVLVDFGSARLQHRNRTHTQVLTPAYAPIEQHSTGATQGPPTDIYALASTSYRALVGTSISSAPDRILADDYEPLAERLGGADRHWLATIDRGLAVRPESRPQTVEEWRTDLATAAADASSDPSTSPLETAEPTPDVVSLPVPDPESGTGKGKTRDSRATTSLLSRPLQALAALLALLCFGAALSHVLSTENPSRNDPSGNVSPVELPDADAAIDTEEPEEPSRNSPSVSGPLLEPPAAVDTEKPETPSQEASPRDEQPLEAPATTTRTRPADPPVEEEETPPASFRVDAEPLNSRVEFLTSHLPYVPGMPLPPGEYRVQVSAPGHRSYQTVVEHGADPTVLVARLTADPEAMFQLGERHYYGSGTRRDYGAALHWYRKAAERGHAEAQFSLGVMYSEGQGLPQDHGEAVAWYRKAADHGLLVAQRELGWSLFSGRGVSRNVEQAETWLRAAADRGDVKALEYLAILYSEAADQGSTAAQLSLASMYTKGKGVLRDLRKAAEGNATAQYNLGLMYHDGQGVLQDHGQALAWYRRAANQGHTDAQFKLGMMYDDYEAEPPQRPGVSSNPKIWAYAWFNIAAAQGHEEAKKRRDYVFSWPIEDRRAEAQKLSRGLAPHEGEAAAQLRKTATGGSAAAQYRLGLMYHDGEGVLKDHGEAVTWYRQAAHQGHTEAQLKLGMMYDDYEAEPPQRPGVSSNPKIWAYAWFNIAAAQGHEEAKKRRDYVFSWPIEDRRAEAQKLSRDLALTLASQ